MNLLSYNAFLLGAIIFLAVSLCNLMYIWLCKIWKIKIVEVSIFLNPGFSLVKKEVNGIVYILGWLPVGTIIKPLGESKEDLEKMAIEELPYTFSSKSRTKQVLFRLSDSLVWLVFLFVSLFALKGPGNILRAIDEMFNYVEFALKTMFDSSLHNEFVNRTNSLLMDSNIIAFASILLIVMYLVITPLSKIPSLFPEDGRKTNGLIKLIGYAVGIFVTYMTLWKIPKFVFPFFSFGQIISYLISSLLGLYIVGSLFFLLTMCVAKFKTKPAF
ncbi:MULTISPECIES: hypothetical protein [Niastella]|uniref:YihY/virulence factor BrkB family protein n=1 Tax=Niastella soli TaxID=2821487 RepID=A0ABS3YSB2_9BACT|nr:hypothetical protein [Niastella soli]MBO9200796.1 hypothetical protein [Niastella soli]